MDLLCEPTTETERGLTRVTVRSGVSFLVVQTNSLREHSSALVERELLGLEDSTGGRVALCLSQVDDMCSAFINVLIQSDHRCRGRGGRLVVFGLTHELTGLFRTTGLLKRLTVVNDCKQAERRLRQMETGRRSLFWSWFQRQAA